MSGGQVLEVEAVECAAAVRRECLLIDLVHLSKYTLGNRDLESELLSLFRCQTNVYLERMSASSSPKDWKDAAHSLKGSARGVGAWAVADHAEAAEQLIDPDEAAREGALALLRGTIDETVAHINALLD